ncbi:MAG: cysteine synthase family protein [Candidatus Adiutrix sp.]|jgi:cysteine synthase B|nr:cysteine synthase family protein [Candidatus Adiutrix sp.]
MLLDSIGMTPLIKLRHIRAGESAAGVLAKAEFLNPSGSVKDRPARAMIREGIRSGELTPDKTLIDATSGNMGIAYAMIGAALGYKVALCLPRNANQERKRILKAFNADIIETDPVRGPEGAIAMVQSIFDRSPHLYYHPDQYNNDENWRAHYNTTGVEIWEQTGGRVSHFVAGAGTAGTFVGVARRLKAFNPDVQTCVMRPSSPLHGLEGIRYMPSVPSGFFDESLVDSFIVVSTEEAREMTLQLARLEGLFVGMSSGANVAAAFKLASELPPSAVVATILCDAGFRYLSDKLWDTPKK